MSGPIVRKYGFPNFDKIFGERPLEHGVEDEEKPVDRAEKQGSTPAPKKSRNQEEECWTEESVSADTARLGGKRRWRANERARRGDVRIAGCHLRISLRRKASLNARASQPIGDKWEVGMLVVATDRVAAAEDGVRPRDQVGTSSDFQAFIGPVFDLTFEPVA